MYKVIQSGSKGNATVIKDVILIDCGVTFKKLKSYYKKLKLVCLTHIHTDHFNKATIRKLAYERPTLRFACGNWLVDDLLDCGVNKTKIDVLEFDLTYSYGQVKIVCFELFHNVKNCGYKVIFNDYKVIYATDTSHIETKAQDFDLYLIEANYDSEDLKYRIEQKESNNEYVYEYNLPNRHHSIQKCNEYLLNNMGENGEYVYMHMHKEG